MIKIAITGISGRMGTRIGCIASLDKELEIKGATEIPGSSAIGKDIGDVLNIKKLGIAVVSGLDKIEEDYDVIVDFTTPKASMKHLDEARRQKKAIVIGTTGFVSYNIEIINKSSNTIPILYSPNMSKGANVLFELSEKAAKELGGNYEVEIIEAHHNKKKDAPSGTCKMLGESVSKVTGKTPPMHSIRMGDIVGDHTVIFVGQSERIELTHRANSRDALANGAIDACKFLAKQKPGLYNMHDVLKTSCKTQDTRHK